jgi:hypothetical protein
MAANVTPAGKSRTTTQSTKLGARRGQGKIKFGSVVITAAKPKKATVAANVARSSQALERVAKKLIKPGFTVRARKGVPRYSVDPADPKLFVRQLDGRTDRGRLVDGRFEVVD